MIRLLLVYPLRITCELLTAVLHAESDICVAGFVNSSNEALTEVTKQRCNTVLFDVNLSDHQGLLLTRKLHQIDPDIKVLVTGLVTSNRAILHFIEEGVDGYVLEDESLWIWSKRSVPLMRIDF
ncbi:MAG: response regulator [Caldilineaceae bacterium]